MAQATEEPARSTRRRVSPPQSAVDSEWVRPVVSLASHPSVDEATRSAEAAPGGGQKRRRGSRGGRRHRRAEPQSEAGKTEPETPIAAVLPDPEDKLKRRRGNRGGRRHRKPETVVAK